MKPRRPEPVGQAPHLTTRNPAALSWTHCTRRESKAPVYLTASWDEPAAFDHPECIPYSGDFVIPEFTGHQIIDFLLRPVCRHSFRKEYASPANSKIFWQIDGLTSLSAPPDLDEPDR